MLAAASIGVFVIPMLYVAFQSLRERTGWKPVKVTRAVPAEAPPILSVMVLRFVPGRERVASVGRERSVPVVCSAHIG